MCDLINNLPNEVLVRIFRYLDLSDQITLTQVSRRFFNLFRIQVHNLPGTYHGDLPYLTKAITRSNHSLLIHNDSSISTGRSFLLNKSLQIIDPASIDPSGTDNYCSALKFDVSFINHLIGKKVLDIGCGLSIFFAEATVLFGAEVHRLDLSAPGFTAEHVRRTAKQYLETMSVLLYIDRNYPEFINQCTSIKIPITRRILSSAKGNLGLVCKYYEREFANNLSSNSVEDMPYGDNTYDLIVCNWVFMYLSKDVQDAALQEIVRVTAPGGEIRIYPGNTLGRRCKLTRDRLRSMKFKRKSIQILHYESDELIILSVIEDKCVVM